MKGWAGPPLRFFDTFPTLCSVAFVPRLENQCGETHRGFESLPLRLS